MIQGFFSSEINETETSKNPQGHNYISITSPQTESKEAQRLLIKNIYILKNPSVTLLIL